MTESATKPTTASDPGSRSERILDAAVEEFAAHGYSGARTAAIAQRAGVNAQLISYHFGGKEGLLNALRERWAALDAQIPPSSASFVDRTTAYIEATLANPSWARLLAWQALGDGPDPESSLVLAQAERQRESVNRTRERQREGELRSDVDAELVVLLGYLLAFAPILMPGVVETIFGEGEPWRGYRRRVTEQLPRLLASSPIAGGGER